MNGFNCCSGPSDECDCGIIKKLKNENKRLKLQIIELETVVKQFEEAKGRSLDRQEPTLEELKKEVGKGIAQMDAGLGIPAEEVRARRIRAKIEQIKDESYYKKNAELLKDDAWTAITTEAAKHIFAEGSLLDRMGGMPPTVELDKNASSGIRREPTPKQYDRVELLEYVDDLPRGSRGTVVDIYVTNGQVGYYVEFPKIKECYMLDLSQIKVVKSD